MLALTKSPPAWKFTAQSRRMWFTALVIFPTIFASALLAQSFAYSLPLWLEAPILIIFILLFSWVSIGFWTALAGFILLLRGSVHVSQGSPELSMGQPRKKTRVAVVIPIYNEEVGRVALGLLATYRSLESVGALSYFDFFLLSDTRDPEIWLKEEVAWAGLCKMLEGFGRIHYRRRSMNKKAKSGNIADFCRRWGRGYEYMVVLDADSVMSGRTLLDLLKMMEGNPQIGIIQTQPVAVNRETLYARLQQFAHRLYGPLFSAGLRFLQLGDGHYIGHNAILRITPFMRHCALPVLPGDPPLGGVLLSHDFVEAALMARGGWEVWFVPELDGSYEEVPPTLIDDLKRDRRWVQGNLQHMRLLWSEGLRSAHRLLFINGVMSFLAAPLWGGFLLLGAVATWYWQRTGGGVNAEGIFELFPVWVFGLTAFLLFSPKFMALFWVIAQPHQATRFGGGIRLGLSVILETLYSILMAPIRMLFHSQFVFQVFRGKSTRWGAQVRSDQAISWAGGWQDFGWCSAVGVILAVLVYFFLGKGYFDWLAPVLLGMAMAVPLAVWTSRSSVGRAARQKCLFVIPEEHDPPAELLELSQEIWIKFPCLKDDPFVQVVVDPQLNALHVALQRNRNYSVQHRLLCQKALELGPDHLTQKERNTLLGDRHSMLSLHLGVWSLVDKVKMAQWRLEDLDSVARSPVSLN